MTIQRIFSLQPATLPTSKEPDYPVILIRSAFIGAVTHTIAAFVTRDSNLRLAASLGSAFFTYCFESWRASRVDKPKSSTFPTDLEGQNALGLKLVTATPEKWVEIWNQFCSHPDVCEHLVPGNFLLSETMQQVF